MIKRLAFVRAFTLVELSISLAIIMILTFILMARYPETAVRLNLANTTHTVSLLVREAQVRGSAVDSANSSLSGYGVYLTLSSPTLVTLFGDTVDIGDVNAPRPYGLPIGNGIYETTPVNETSTITTFPPRYVISKLCGLSSSQYVCNSNFSPSISSLTVSFTRPNPIPSIYINNNVSTPISAACIELRSPRAPLSGHVRNVQVFSSGMIRTGVGSCDGS